MTEKEAREQLMDAVEVLAARIGEAQWTSGYRCGAKLQNDDDLYRREMAKWDLADPARERIENALRRYKQAVARGRARTVARGATKRAPRRKA